MICFKCGSEMPDDAYFCGVCSTQLKEKYFERIHLPTPHGGVMSEFCFFDEDRNPCVKEKAWFMEISEYDAEGQQVYRYSPYENY